MNKKVKIVLIVVAVIILAEVALTGTLLVVKHNAENSYAQHLELAQKYLEDGDYEEAIAEFELAIEIQPKQTDAYTGLADAYIAMGDYEAAVDILNEGYEATGERTVRSKLKSTQELMAEAMASAAEAMSAAETAEAESTENAEQTVEVTEAEVVEAVSAEASSNEYYYAVATTLTKAAVEEYASNVRNLFIQHKWSNLAGMIEFPITIDGITYDSIASFVQGGLDDIYSEDFMDALEAEDCVDMYCSADGIVLGNSNVVIAEVEKNGASALKIVGVNGLIDEEKVDEGTESVTEENAVVLESTQTAESEQTAESTQTTEDFVMVWNDANLEAAMREITGITEGDIMYSDVCDITELDLAKNNISDISALGSLTNLTELNLISNNISDISALGSLTNLTTLWLDNNNISDISALGSLTNLTTLYLVENNISDISALGSLTNLTTLFLNENNISDVSALGKLTNMEFLGLAENNISDISALGSLINLKILYLMDNDITDTSVLSDLTNCTIYLYNSELPW